MRALIPVGLVGRLIGKMIPRKFACFRNDVESFIRQFRCEVLSTNSRGHNTVEFYI